MKPRIMYIERKLGVDGIGRIGRVTFSQTGRTLYYGGREFIRIKSYKANHMDIETREEYWISGPKKRGGDTLHGGTIHTTKTFAKNTGAESESFRTLSTKKLFSVTVNTSAQAAFE